MNSTEVQNPRRNSYTDYGCMYYTTHSLLQGHLSSPPLQLSICRVSAPGVQNCIRVRMRNPSVLQSTLLFLLAETARGELYLIFILAFPRYNFGTEGCFENPRVKIQEKPKRNP